jgi:hypothetical protein
MIKTLLPAAALAAVAFTTGAALASPTCTDAPKDKWISEEAMKQKIADLGYKDIKTFKVTKGNCYEIYGYDKNGKKAEVYFSPVDGSIVKAE